MKTSTSHLVLVVGLLLGGTALADIAPPESDKPAEKKSKSSKKKDKEKSRKPRLIGIERRPQDLLDTQEPAPTTVGRRRAPEPEPEGKQPAPDAKPEGPAKKKAEHGDAPRP